MKAEGTSKTKLYIAIVLVLIAIFTVGRTFLSIGGGEHGTAASSLAKGKAAGAADSLDPRLHLDLLKNSEAVKYEGAGKNIFRSVAEVVIPPVKISPLLQKQREEAARKAAGPPPPPPPPPINLKFFGYSNSPGERPKVFLSQGDDVWIAREGDVVDRRYKIVRVSPSAVVVEDLLNSNSQSIQLTQG